MFKIWYWWYLFWQIGSEIAQEVYNKVNITFDFVQYHFIALNKMQYYYNTVCLGLDGPAP